MLRRRAVFLFVAMAATLFAVANPAWATTFTVNSTADTGDTTPDGTCNTCTLSEAMQEATFNDNAPTVDVINFSISGDGPHTFSPATELPDIDEPLTIDGYTQGDSTPAILTDDAKENTLAFGTNAVLKIVIKGPSTFSDPNNGFDGFDVEAGPTTIRGLVLNGFKSSSSGSGGQAIGFFNVEGNTNNVVEGNFIGTNIAGTAVDPTNGPNDGDGVIINGPASTGNTIGGSTPAARNLISGNDEQGVEISASDGNKVQGNLIGTDKNGTGDLGNKQDGVRMGSSSKNVVTNNVVAFNGDSTHNDNGVEVQKSGTVTPVGNRILSNSIFENQALGIDLNDTTGLAPGDPEGREQDAKDPDTGPNNLQNFPVITAATSTGTTTTITGTLRSKPSKTFTVQLFSNPLITNEGKTFLGQVQVKTNTRGKAIFSFLGTFVPQANPITATATGADATSEFSDAVGVVPAS
jgi:parallel beta-helix repeat protein